MTTTSLALFSGGLDSLLACRVVSSQGIKVIAVNFVSPFFGYSLLDKENSYKQEIKDRYAIDVILNDTSLTYLQMLRSPAHGYGRHFNPCIDCKILLFSQARKMMVDLNASFLITGEVLGQRPMSQRRDTLRLIERESGCEGFLLRPLCAKNQVLTKVELEGLIDREKLYNFKGRTRTPQMELAKKFGITDYPSPAGGCVLTDPVLGRRIQRFYDEHNLVSVNDMLLIQVGRQFILPGGGWLVLGRKEAENDKIEALCQEQDVMLKTVDRPGPTAIVRFASGREDVELAAGLVVRYSKKGREVKEPENISITTNGESTLIRVMPLEDQIFQSWTNK